MKFILVLCLASIAIVNAFPGCPGCPSEVDANQLGEVADVLKSSLTKLSAGEEGPTLELVRINSATTQVVSGSKHVINADLKDKDGKIKTCNIEIWSQLWLKTDDAVQITFDCPGEKKLVRTHAA